MYILRTSTSLSELATVVPVREVQDEGHVEARTCMRHTVMRQMTVFYLSN